MMSGAPNSMSFLSLLLRLITLRYKSLRSDAAYLPPSSGTIGRSSGGSTGSTSNIIHSGLLPLTLNASITSKRFTALVLFALFALSALSEMMALSSADSFSRSILASNSLIASAPIPTLKEPSPSSLYLSLISASSLSSITSL